MQLNEQMKVFMNEGFIGYKPPDFVAIGGSKLDNTCVNC